MKKTLMMILLACMGTAYAWSAAAKAAAAADPELEKLRLQKETLQLEIEKLKLQATMGPSQTTAPAPVAAQPYVPTSKRDAMDHFQDDYSKQARSAAETNKDDAGLLVLDLVNGEVWYKGTRYNINEWNALADNMSWKGDKRLEGRDPSGNERDRFTVRNAALIKYRSRKRGIFEIAAPKGDDDFRILTPEGLSFKSSQEDVRNAYQNVYFQYDRQKRDKKGVQLRYKHGKFWAFDDKTEIYFDKDGRMTKLRYGVLDER